MTLNEYVEAWSARTTHFARNTSVGYECVLRRHVLAHEGPDGQRLGDTALAEITIFAVRRMLQGMLTASYAINTAKMALTALASVLADAKLDGHVVLNVTHGAGDRLWPKADHGAPKAFTPDEQRMFLITAKTDERRYARQLLLLARTGLRLGESLGLQARHVLDRGGLLIDQTYHGAGRLGPPKNRQPRVVDLSPDAQAVLGELVSEAGTPERWLFANGAQPYNPGSVQDVFKRVLEAAELPAHHTPHTLRHTWASIMLDVVGAPLSYVREQLGHASITITNDLYGSWLRVSRLDLVAQLDALPERHAMLRAELPGRKVIPFPMHLRR
jgi:integrase